MILTTRSSSLRCSTPQARAGIGWPMMTLSLISPQSVQTMPSKPSSFAQQLGDHCRG